MKNEFSNPVKELSLEFSLLLIGYFNSNGSKNQLNSKYQLIRSGTSIGANIREAQGAESRKDFIHKMKIAFKEAEETEYWLLITAKLTPGNEIDTLLSLLIQIKKPLSKIISTSILNDKL